MYLVATKNDLVVTVVTSIVLAKRATRLMVILAEITFIVLVSSNDLPR